MSNKLSKLAMRDVAEVLLKENKDPMNIHDLLQQVAKVKGIDEDDIGRLTQLYLDITQSAKFVYCGDDLWDLKERNLEMWDKDGYAFIQAEAEVIEEDEDEDDLDFTEFNLPEEDEEKPVIDDDEDDEKKLEIDEEELEDEKEYIKVELPLKSTDDDDDDDDDIEIFDEEDYDEIMDDYEDMYDDE